MSNFTISIFDNKIFFQILKEIKLFTKFKIKHYEGLDLYTKDVKKEKNLAVFFTEPFHKIKVIDFPLISNNPFGIVFVRLPNRVDEPAARIIAFIFYKFLYGVNYNLLPFNN